MILDKTLYKQAFFATPSPEEENEPKGTFEGYASTYNNIDLEGDTFASGAFDKFLNKTTTIKLLFNHDYNKPVGLGKLENTDKGLRLKGSLNLQTQTGRDLYSNMQFGIVDSMSVGAYIHKYEIDYEDDKKIFKITEASLAEVSLVTSPANEEAKITAVKMLIKQKTDINTIHTIKEAERFLRDVGLSNTEAKHLISVIKSVSESNLRDVDKQKQLNTVYDEVENLCQMWT